ncbi:IGF-like family receptor 1 [Channa argus]|uniref:IGF-like family receptor 1 n=1 Tax=Channa argus TaxID=215402 RepID=UPI00352114D1
MFTIQKIFRKCRWLMFFYLSETRSGRRSKDILGAENFSPQRSSVMEQGHSKNCPDLTKRWYGVSRQCVDCPRKPGYEVTPNCGFDDDGGRHEIPLKPCGNNTFNNGSTAKCQTCSVCETGYDIFTPCNSTTDTHCQPKPPTTPGSTFQATKGPTGSLDSASYVLSWAAPLAIFIFCALVLFAWIMYKKWKKDTLAVIRFSPLSAAEGDADLKNILNPNILSAPLQTLLDNLDVVEELVILLDPETHGVKNTKHLAFHCKFPSTWITYTYSMKDSKSPLRAVLENISSRNPDWTVEHLAKLLKLIERNDAIAVLAKL